METSVHCSPAKYRYVRWKGFWDTGMEIETEREKSRALLLGIRKGHHAPILRKISYVRFLYEKIENSWANPLSQMPSIYLKITTEPLRLTPSLVIRCTERGKKKKFRVEISGIHLHVSMSVTRWGWPDERALLFTAAGCRVRLFNFSEATVK